MPPRNIVVVAVPDQLHFDVIMTALRHDQHVCAVKPLVLKHAEAMEIEREAHARGLVVGVEYHKRFDDRSLMARRKYRAGLFGEFKLGTACLMEKWYYRHSNFQNWMTTENSDAFTYIGCHYVDLVHFITGLLPDRGERLRHPRPVSERQGRLPLDRCARDLEQRRVPERAERARAFPTRRPAPTRRA